MVGWCFLLAVPQHASQVLRELQQGEGVMHAGKGWGFARCWIGEGQRESTGTWLCVGVMIVCHKDVVK